LLSSPGMLMRTRPNPPSESTNQRQTFISPVSRGVSRRFRRALLHRASRIFQRILGPMYASDNPTKMLPIVYSIMTPTIYRKASGENIGSKRDEKLITPAAGQVGTTKPSNPEALCKALKASGFSLPPFEQDIENHKAVHGLHRHRVS